MTSSKKIYVVRSADIPPGKQIWAPHVQISDDGAVNGVLFINPKDEKQALYWPHDAGLEVYSIRNHFDPTYTEDVFETFNGHLGTKEESKTDGDDLSGYI